MSEENKEGICCECGVNFREKDISGISGTADSGKEVLKFSTCAECLGTSCFAYMEKESEIPSPLPEGLRNILEKLVFLLGTEAAIRAEMNKEGRVNFDRNRVLLGGGIHEIYTASRDWVFSEMKKFAETEKASSEAKNQPIQ